MNELTRIETMTSMQIAEVTGKEHKNVLRDIRNMENAWIKISGRKFELTEYNDAQGKKRPMYALTKSETLYIATKFNDEARAKLVLRWEELEKANRNIALPNDYLSALKALLESEEKKIQLVNANNELVENNIALNNRILQIESSVKELKRKSDYTDIVLQSKGTLTIKSIAQDYGMSANRLNEILHKLKIQYKSGDQWFLYADYIGKGYVSSRTITLYHRDGRPFTKSNTEWTQRGRLFLYEKLKQNGILPTIEKICE